MVLCLCPVSILAQHSRPHSVSCILSSVPCVSGALGMCMSVLCFSSWRVSHPVPEADTQSQSCVELPHLQVTLMYTLHHAPLQTAMETSPQKIYPGEEFPGCGGLRENVARGHHRAPMSSLMECGSPNALGLVILLLSFDLSCPPHRVSRSFILLYVLFQFCPSILVSIEATPLRVV